MKYFVTLEQYPEEGEHCSQNLVREVEISSEDMDYLIQYVNEHEIVEEEQEI